MSAPAAPYPADTLSKGWRFEIHMEKVKKSDTWLRARSGEMRGALMLLWGEAWEQSPCGSLPNDDELVALIIDMPLAKFKKNRDLLMRGWSLASDGRLYHETITDRVLAMMDKRANDAKRAANRRAREAESAATSSLVTGASRVTSMESTVSSTPSTKHQAPIPEAIASGASAKPPRATRKCPESFVVTEAMLAWVSENCPQALVGTETDKFRDYTFRSAISDWPAAWRNWIRKSVEFRGNGGAPAPTFRERDEQRAIARMAEMTGGLVSAKPNAPCRDALQEVFDAPRVLG